MPAGPRKPKPSAGSHGGTFISRKLSKRSPSFGKGKNSAQSEEKLRAQQEPADGERVDSRMYSQGIESSQEQEQDQAPPRPQFPVKSIIPDQLAELPAWYTKDDDWATASAAQFRTKYPLHNPRGPRYYRNHHLAPPSRDRRPPSVFSPSFPPMAASTERLQDTAQLPGSSRTPSGSPLPTPTSSQTRIHDVRGRTRKLSQTAQDNVDMMDVTDPWGTSWHHQSPYDAGMGHERTSPVSPEVRRLILLPIQFNTVHQSPNIPPRPRRASHSSGPRHRTTVPSPLSQSTSAVHLASESTIPHIPRRLSKTRKSFRGLFSNDHHRGPYISRHGSSTAVELSTNLDRKLSKTGSFIPHSISSSTQSLVSPEKRKRGSVLGRLAKRFSLIRRSDTATSMKHTTPPTRLSMQEDYGRTSYQLSDQSSPSSTTQPPMRRARTSIDVISRRRVPPPNEANRPPSPPGPDSAAKGDDANSNEFATDALVLGKLTVANPDDSFSSTETQRQATTQGTHHHGIFHPHRLSDDDEERVDSVFDIPLRSSPSPIDDPRAIKYTALSVISEGETYLSSPKVQATPTPHVLPTTSHAAPSMLSLAPPPPEQPAVPDPPVSPPLPDLPPPTPVPKSEPSLPPTPESSAPPSLSGHGAIKSISPQSTAQESSTSLVQPSLMSIRASTSGLFDSSPLSRVSMIANPPTPQVHVATPLPSMPEEHTGRDNAPADQNSSTRKNSRQRSRSRYTETFRLVRSSSGHTPAGTGDTFVADGEHWEVVESPVEESSRKRSERTKTSDSDKPKRRDSKKVEPPDEPDAQKAPDRRQSVHESHNREPSSAQDQDSTAQSFRKSTSERRTSKRDSQTEVTRSTRTTIATDQYFSTTLTPRKSSGSRSERRPSTSTRPSSELHPMTDLNALKAKDAWEIERLWKGRSMVDGSEGTALPGHRRNITSDSRPSTIMSADLHRASTIPSVGDQASIVTSSHGSGHTLFVVQAPYGSSSVGNGSQSTLSPSIPLDRSHRSLIGQVALSSSPPEFPTPKSNPLPEPPRMSSYKPSPLPGSIAGGSEGSSSSEYWTKYAGMTVTQ